MKTKELTERINYLEIKNDEYSKKIRLLEKKLNKCLELNAMFDQKILGYEAEKVLEKNSSKQNEKI